MFAMHENNEYAAKINGIQFVCDTVEADFEETAMQLAQIYADKLDSIAQFMLDEGITDCYGDLTPQEIIEALGTPTIDLSRCLVTYLEHTLDDAHCIEFEYAGLLDEFLYLSIDG